MTSLVRYPAHNEQRPRIEPMRFGAWCLVLFLCCSLMACKTHAKEKQIHGAWVVDVARTLEQLPDQDREALERTIRATRFGVAFNRDQSIDAHVIAYLPLYGEVQKVADSTHGTYRVIDATRDTLTLEIQGSDEGEFVELQPAVATIKILDDAHIQMVPQTTSGDNAAVMIRDRLVLKRVTYESFPAILSDPSSVPTLQDLLPPDAKAPTEK